MSKKNIILIVLSTLFMAFSILFASIRSAEARKQASALKAIKELHTINRAKAKKMEEISIELAVQAVKVQEVIEEAKNNLVNCKQGNL